MNQHIVHAVYSAFKEYSYYTMDDLSVFVSTSGFSYREAKDTIVKMLYYKMLSLTTDWKLFIPKGYNEDRKA